MPSVINSVSPKLKNIKKVIGPQDTCETNLVRNARNVPVYIKNKKAKAKLMLNLMKP